MFNKASTDNLHVSSSGSASASTALPGRSTPIEIDPFHAINGNSMQAPFPENLEKAMFGLGCFWGAEKIFWSIEGVYVTSVGYSAGSTPNPSYDEVCSGLTGHNEVVLVLFNPDLVSYELLLEVFWLSHNPTQGMRQGNDQGAQYRSGIYTFSECQNTEAYRSLEHYAEKLKDSELGEITTEIKTATDFYYAETYHQQYLAKNPDGYCGLGGTGVAY